MRIAAAADEDSATQNRRQVPNSSVEEELVELESKYLPPDIVIGTLSRLPVKTLFRFKSVCKNWDAMINPGNPYLVSMHLKNYTDSPATKASLVCAYDERYNRRSVSLCPDGQRPINLDGSLLGSVICSYGAGLFLLGDPYESGHDCRLWNPATREIRHLPDPPLPPRNLDPSLYMDHHDFCGVGIDLVANDIKVVVIRNYYYLLIDDNYRSSPIFSAPVFVYTLRSNCWKKLAENYPDMKGQEVDARVLSCPTYFKGSFYWLVTKDGCVVTFDMGSDVFHTILCPFGTDADRSCNLSIYRDSIALFQSSMSSSSSSNFGVDIWLLSKSSTEGDQWCWIKHSSLDVPEGLDLLRWWKDDQFIAQTLQPRNELVLFDIGSQECKTLMCHELVTNSCHIYKESLLCLK